MNEFLSQILIGSSWLSQNCMYVDRSLPNNNEKTTVYMIYYKQNKQIISTVFLKVKVSTIQQVMNFYGS